MVKIKALPDLKRIKGMKGTIDFYIHKGVPCARQWPKKPRQPRSPASQASAARFGYAAHLLATPPPLLKLFGTMAAADGPTTWKDALLLAYFGHLITEDPPLFTPWAETEPWAW